MADIVHTIAFPFLNPKLKHLGDAIGVKSDGRPTQIILPGLGVENAFPRNCISNTHAMFIMPDKSVIEITDEITFSYYTLKNDDFETMWSKDIRAYAVAVGKAFIAALYPSRISIFDMMRNEVDRIKFNASAIPTISSGRSDTPRALPVHGSKIVFAYRSRWSPCAVDVYDMQKRDIENIYEGGYISSDGRYLFEQIITDIDQDFRFKVTSIETGAVVFEDILPRDVVRCNVQAGHIIAQTEDAGILLVNLETLDTISVPAYDIVITNDGYVATVSYSDWTYGERNSFQQSSVIYSDDRIYRPVHIFKLSNLPRAQAPFMNRHIVIFPANAIQAYCVTDGV